MKLKVSAVEKQFRCSGDSRLKGPHESQTVPADDSRQRKRTGDLGIYCDAIVASVRNSDSIPIFGPGEAKGELKKRLIRDWLDKRIVQIEAADKMTDHQMAVKVREYFH